MIELSDHTHVGLRRVLAVMAAISLILSLSLTSIQATSLGYERIDVHTAHAMVNSGQYPNLLVLDVRSAGEFGIGHLEDAASIPFDQLDSRLDELVGQENDEVIVYCRSGFTSQMAAELLVLHGFTKVYDIIGGITAWVEAELPIWTVTHFVSVGPGSSMEIAPLLFQQTDCDSCGQNTTCTPPEFQTVILEQDEHHIVQLTTFEFNGTTFEVTTTTTIIWQFSETSRIMNKTAAFVSTQITSSDFNMLLYGLKYQINHTDYFLSVETGLTPLDSDSYNKSSTMVFFKPVEDSDIVSLEFINLAKPAKLSQIYEDIALVVKKVGKEYEESSDDIHRTLARRYGIIRDDVDSLSKLVKTSLTEYDKTVLESIAIVFDACTLECFAYHLNRCYGWLSEFTIACLWGCALGCMWSLILFPICIWPCVEFCGWFDIGVLIGCILATVIICCFSP